LNNCKLTVTQIPQNLIHYTPALELVTLSWATFVLERQVRGLELLGSSVLCGRSNLDSEAAALLSEVARVSWSKWQSSGAAIFCILRGRESR
jgi:hypothetical protein